MTEISDALNEYNDLRHKTKKSLSTFVKYINDNKVPISILCKRCINVLIKSWRNSSQLNLHNYMHLKTYHNNIHKEFITCELWIHFLVLESKLTISLLNVSLICLEKE